MAGDEQRRHDARERLLGAYRGRARAEQLWTEAIAEARAQGVYPAEAARAIVAEVEMQPEEILDMQKELKERLS